MTPHNDPYGAMRYHRSCAVGTSSLCEFIRVGVLRLAEELVLSKSPDYKESCVKNCRGVTQYAHQKVLGDAAQRHDAARSERVGKPLASSSGKHLDKSLNLLQHAQSPLDCCGEPNARVHGCCGKAPARKIENSST